MRLPQQEVTIQQTQEKPPVVPGAWIPVEAWFSKIENPAWQQIVRATIGNIWERIYSYPAAKTNHHAFRSRPCYHTATMVAADSIGDIYPQLNKSLLFTGIMLHGWPRWSSWRGLKIQNTLFRAASSATLHWSWKKSRRSCKELKIDDQKESHRSLRRSSPESPWLARALVVPVRPKDHGSRDYSYDR